MSTVSTGKMTLTEKTLRRNAVRAYRKHFGADPTVIERMLTVEHHGKRTITVLSVYVGATGLNAKSSIYLDESGASAQWTSTYDADREHPVHTVSGEYPTAMYRSIDLL